MEHWLLIRQDVEKPEERAYYTVFAPCETPLEELVRIAGTRWRIESCIEENRKRGASEGRLWIGRL